ncbi:MAG: hypothetical protein ACXVBW_07495 [Bdellovibrionota bacterium]
MLQALTLLAAALFSNASWAVSCPITPQLSGVVESLEARAAETTDLQGLRAAIAELERESGVLATRTWTPEQLSEIRAEAGLPHLGEEALKEFYTARLGVSIRNLKAAERNIVGERILSNLKIAHPELKFVDEAKALTVIQGAAQTGVESLSAEQVKALLQLQELQAEVFQQPIREAALSSKYFAKRSSVLRKKWPALDAQLAEQKQALQAHTNELKEQIGKIAASSFPNGEFPKQSDLDRALRFRGQVARPCCGHSCPGCPIQRIFYHANEAEALKQIGLPAATRTETAPQLPLFRFARQYRDWIPTSFDARKAP